MHVGAESAGAAGAAGAAPGAAAAAFSGSDTYSFPPTAIGPYVTYPSLPPPDLNPPAAVIIRTDYRPDGSFVADPGASANQPHTSGKKFVEETRLCICVAPLFVGFGL